MSQVTHLDNRVAYGATCTWWDSIHKVGKSASGLPCCPHCKGVLFEAENEGEWFTSADRYEKNGHPGYRVMLEWARDKCFKSMTEMKKVYDAEKSV